MEREGPGQEPEQVTVGAGGEGGLGARSTGSSAKRSFYFIQQGSYSEQRLRKAPSLSEEEDSTGILFHVCRERPLM